MAWYVTSGVLQYADEAPAPDSILTDIMREGEAVIPEGVTHIAQRAFFCIYGLTDVKIPVGVVSIGKEAFRGCERLKSISFPEGLRVIGEAAFEGCFCLKNIHLPESVTEIGKRAFNRCVSIREINIPEGITVIEAGTFCGCRHLPHIDIPKNVTTIRIGAFLECDTLRSVIIPENVKSLERDAFTMCNDLTSVTIRSADVKFDKKAFWACSSLINIELPQENSGFYWENGLMISNDGVLTWCPVNVEQVSIPKGVTRIGNMAFDGCSLLGKIEIPQGVTSIESRAFFDCIGLRSISFPNSLTDIGEWAFYGCKNLGKINISADHPAFRWENKLLISKDGELIWCSTNAVNVEIPQGVICVSEGAFEECSQLKSIRFPASLKKLGENSFAAGRTLEHISIDAEAEDIFWLRGKGFSAVKSIVISGQLLQRMDHNLRNQLTEIRCIENVGKVPMQISPIVFKTFAMHEADYSHALRKEHISVLKKRIGGMVKEVFECPQLLRLVCREKLISAMDIDAFIEEAVDRNDTEATAMLLDYQTAVLTMEAVFKARELKRKLCERKENIAVERIMARANRVGISGMIFAAADRLTRFASRNQLGTYIRSRGGRLHTVMSEETDYFITNEEDSEEIEKAAQLGITVITEEEFLEIADGR